MKRLPIFITLALTILKVSGQISLTVQHTRSQSTSPNSYIQTFESHFKYGNDIGLSEAGMNPFYTILGLRGWLSDNTGGKAHELAFSNDNQIYFRSGYSPTWESWKKLVLTDAAGNVGIGTTSPTETLTVAGNINAREVKVTATAGADFVFEKGYRLPDLKEVEKYISDNKHLPEIPSAREMV